MSAAGGRIEWQQMCRFGPDWSGQAQRLWTKAKVGDRIDIGLRAQKAARYNLKVRLTKGPGYGIFQPFFDDVKIGASST